MTDNDVRRIEDKVDNVHLVLAELRGSLQPTLDKLSGDQEDADKVLVDHEKRIRALERFRFSVPSLAFLALICAVVEAIYYLIHLH